MSIVLVGSTSGSITLQEPAVSGSTVLDLPATTGTVVLQNGSNNLLMNSGYGSDAVAYGCRAWVNFNGTGTVAIRASGNVSSITDNGVGLYTVNFSTSMPDANYSTVATSQHHNAVTKDVTVSGGDFSNSASSVQLFTVSAGSDFDTATLNVAVFR